VSRRRAKEARRARATGAVPEVWVVALAMAVSEARTLREKQRRWGRPPKRAVAERQEKAKEEGLL